MTPQPSSAAEPRPDLTAATLAGFFAAATLSAVIVNLICFAKL